MIQTMLSVLRSSSERGPATDVDHDRFFGFVTLFVGLSLVLVSLKFVAENTVSMFPVAGGGWLLVGIGSNLLRGRDPFHSDWTDDGDPGRVSRTVLAIATVLIFAAALFSVVNGLVAAR